MGKMPIIFDCDPGHDDAIALLVALASEKLDVRAVTTVGGNAVIENTTRNALKVLELAGRTDIPVGKGAQNPTIAKLLTAPKVHGESGMEGPVLPEPVTKPSELSAVELMAKVVSESPEPVTLVLTGPFTNAAIFLLAYPKLKSKIKRISAMGGAVCDGHRTALAEFNILCDPEAAHIVMESGIPVDLYPLDVTHKAHIKQEEFHLFREQGNKIADFVADLLDFFVRYYIQRVGYAFCPMHDSCAVAGLIEPRLFTYEQCKIAVELDGRVSRGAIMADLRNDPRRAWPYNGRVALEVEREKFVQLILDSCERLAQKNAE